MFSSWFLLPKQTLQWLSADRAQLLILDSVPSTCSPSFPASNSERSTNSVETTREEFLIAGYQFAHFSSHVYLVIPVQYSSGFPIFSISNNRKQRIKKEQKPQIWRFWKENFMFLRRLYFLRNEISLMHSLFSDIKWVRIFKSFLSTITIQGSFPRDASNILQKIDAKLYIIFFS